MNSADSAEVAPTASTGSKPKAIQVVESFAYGTAKSVKQLAGFLKTDFDVEVFYCDRDGTATELLNIDPDIQWTALKSSGFLKHVKNIFAIRKQLDSRCHVVHGHSSYGGMYARLATLGKPVPHVFFSPRGYAFLREDMFWAKRALFLSVEWALAFFGTTVACGPSEYKVGEKFSRRIVNINNSVVVPGGDVVVADDPFSVLAIGRIAPQKGFDTFLAVAARMPHIRFTWVGSCDDDYFDKAVERAGGLPGNINMIGYVQQSNLFDQMRQHTLIIHPSRWEGLSRVLLEALAMGKPLITSTLAANRDCLYPSRAGVVTGQYANGFACNSTSEYVDAITSLHENQLLAESMADASYRLAQQEFDEGVIKRQWVRLYKNTAAT